jgi:hypothetical protein
MTIEKAWLLIPGGINDHSHPINEHAKGVDDHPGSVAARQRGVAGEARSGGLFRDDSFETLADTHPARSG